MQYIIVTFLWVIWCALHSILIDLSVTDYFRDKLGNRFRFYRFAYNLISVATLIPVLYYAHTIKGSLLFSWNGSLILLQLLLFMMAFVLFLGGAKKYDMLKFLGIRQIRSGMNHATLSETDELDMTGIHGIVRHPWYTGAILFLWSINKNIYPSTLIMNIILTIYLVIGAYLEEKKLIVQFGDQYIKYRDNVSMLFPIKWVREKFNF